MVGVGGGGGGGGWWWWVVVETHFSVKLEPQAEQFQKYIFFHNQM